MSEHPSPGDVDRQASLRQAVQTLKQDPRSAGLDFGEVDRIIGAGGGNITEAILGLKRQPGADGLDFGEVDRIIGAGGGN